MTAFRADPRRLEAAAAAADHHDPSPRSGGGDDDLRQRPLAAGGGVLDAQGVLPADHAVHAVAGTHARSYVGFVAPGDLDGEMRVRDEGARHADHVDVPLRHRMFGGGSIRHPGRVQDRHVRLCPDRARQIQIRGGGKPHRRPDACTGLVVRGLASHDADEVDASVQGMGLRDREAVVTTQTSLDHLVPGHPDPHDEIVPDLAPHRFQQLQPEAHAVLERSAVIVFAVVEGGRPELLDQRAGLARDLDPVESALARPAHRLRIVAVDAGDVVTLHLDRKGAVDELAAAGGGERGQPVSAVPALPSAAVGELDHAGGPLLVDARGHRAILGDDRVVRSVDLPVVEGVLDRHRGGAPELGEPHAAARLLLLVAQIALRDVSAHRVARCVAGAEQPVADAQVPDRHRGEECGVSAHGGGIALRSPPDAACRSSSSDPVHDSARRGGPGIRRAGRRLPCTFRRSRSGGR